MRGGVGDQRDIEFASSPNPASATTNAMLIAAPIANAASMRAGAWWWWWP